jgi:hypothetical protein
MKPLFHFRSLLFILLLLSFISSCKKNNFYATPTRTSPPPNSVIQQINQPNKLDTADVIATQWIYNNDHSYSADISSLINETTKSTVHIAAAYINNNGQSECICGLIDYQAGKLWASYPEHEFMINYVSPFGEMPFNRLDLTVVYSK